MAGKFFFLSVYLFELSDIWPRLHSESNSYCFLISGSLRFVPRARLLSTSILSDISKIKMITIEVQAALFGKYLNLIGLLISKMKIVQNKAQLKKNM